jgi:hypothetical protein
VAFALILVSMPFMIEAFSRVIDSGFMALEMFFAETGGGT